MSKVRITAVRKTGDTDSHGNFVFSVDGEDETGTPFTDAYLAQKAQEPRESGIWEGYYLTENKKGNPWLRRESKPQGQPIGRSEPDPARQHSIIRQHSQEMALRYLAVKAELGTVEKEFKPEDLTPIIDWFAKDAGGA